jgi:hypothetical protein
LRLHLAPLWGPAALAGSSSPAAGAAVAAAEALARIPCASEVAVTLSPEAQIQLVVWVSVQQMLPSYFD